MADALLPVERVNEAPGNFPEPAGWQRKLLERLGVRRPSKADIDFLTAWFQEEHGSSGLTGGAGVPGQEYGGVYNTMDTTLHTAGDESLYNVLAGEAGTPSAVGVQNYATPDEGIEANASTLLDSSPSYGYDRIVTGLRSGASLTQLEEAENASAWGSAFPQVGVGPRPPSSPGSANVSAQLTSAVPGIGGLADSFAQGVLSGFRDLAEMLGGVALIALGVYLIARDLGVPVGRLAHPLTLAGRAQRSETASRAEVARTRAEEARQARQHASRRAEAETKRAEHRTARERATVRTEQARARQEEEAARAVRGTAAGGTTAAARRTEHARQRAQEARYRGSTHGGSLDVNRGAGRPRATAGAGAGEEPF